MHIRPQYTTGQLVEFETEAMQAVMYPSGHTEIMVEVCGYGTVMDIEDTDDGYLYNVHTLDIHCDYDVDEVYILEDEIINGFYNINTNIQHLTEI